MNTKQKESEKIPTLEEVLRQHAKTAESQSKYMKLDDVPKEGLKLKWISDEQKPNQKGEMELFVTFETETGKLLVQKYTGTMFTMLADRISGREKELKESFFPYEHVETITFRGKTGFPRLYPKTEETRKKK